MVPNPGKSYGFTTDTSTRPVQIIRVLDPSANIYITDSANVFNQANQTSQGMTRFWETDWGVIDTATASANDRKVGYHHPGGSFNALFGDGHTDFRGTGGNRTDPLEWKCYESN
jgi:prepilin-type processing-associated H-X9-DG protein